MNYPAYRIVSNDSNVKEPMTKTLIDAPKLDKSQAVWIVVGMALMFFPVLFYTIHQREHEKAADTTTQSVRENTQSISALIEETQAIEKRLGIKVKHPAVRPPVMQPH